MAPKPKELYCPSCYRIITLAIGIPSPAFCEQCRAVNPWKSMPPVTEPTRPWRLSLSDRVELRKNKIQPDDADEDEA